MSSSWVPGRAARPWPASWRAAKQEGAAVGARHRPPPAQLLRHLPGRADLLRPHEPALHRGRAEHRPAADGRRRDEHVLRLRGVRRRLAQGQVRRRHRRRSLRDDRGAGDRAAARRAARRRPPPASPRRRRRWATTGSPSSSSSEPARGRNFRDSAGPGACLAVAAGPSGTRPSTWTRRSRPARTCARAPASSAS